MGHPLVFSTEFSPKQQTVIRRAFSEARGMLAVRGRSDVEGAVAASILEAARCGCLRHGELVAVGLASGRILTLSPAA